MSKSLLFTVIIVTCLGVFGCSSTEKITCPDGTVSIIYKNPEKQFNQLATTFDAHLKGTIRLLAKVRLADLDAGLNQEVTQLRDNLDQYSGRTRDILMASYQSLAAAPCDQKVRQTHRSLLSDISEQSSALAELETNLKTITDPGNLGGIDENALRDALEEYKVNSTEVPLKS